MKGDMLVSQGPSPQVVGDTTRLRGPGRPTEGLMRHKLIGGRGEVGGGRWEVLPGRKTQYALETSRSPRGSEVGLLQTPQMVTLQESGMSPMPLSVHPEGHGASSRHGRSRCTQEAGMRTPGLPAAPKGDERLT